LHQLIYEELHKKMGHLESERVVDLAKQRFYWPKMVSDIENFIRKKCKCTKDKKPNVPEKAALVNIKRYAQAFLTKNNRAKTAADKIFNDVVIHLGFLGKFTTTREVNLITRFGYIYKNRVESKQQEQRLITLWAMDSVNE